MSRIRVLHTLTRIYSGGVERLRLTLLRGLPPGRYQHAIICQEALGDLPAQLRAEGAEIHEIGLAPHILNLAWHNRAYQIAREFKPHLIHGAVIEGVALGNGIGMRMPGVAVISEETSDPVGRSWKANLLMRGLCMRSRAVIGVSPAVGDYLRNRARIPASKIRVINNACAASSPQRPEAIAELRAQLGFRTGDLVIGSVGRVVDSHKRFSDLIRALPIVHMHHDRARLMIIGDGADLHELRGLADQMGVADTVLFTGYRGDAARLIQAMDIFALASAHEAFGLVLVEAMLAGVPVIATQVGGIPTVLNHGAAGLLVPPMAPDLMAQAIVQLLDDESDRRGLAIRAKRHAEREFSTDRYCGEIDALYQDVLR